MITEGYCPTLNIKSDRLAEKRMKVYVVFTGVWEHVVEGIFSTEENAESYLNKLGELGWIDEYELDNPES